MCPYPTKAGRFEGNNGEIFEAQNPRTVAEEDKMAAPTYPESEVPADSDAEEPAAAYYEDEMPVSGSEHASEQPAIMAKAGCQADIRPLTPLTNFHYGTGFQRKISQAEEFQQWAGHALWRSDELDYEVPLLAHAKLYVLAHFANVPELENLALQRLQDTLASIGKLPRNSPAVRNLVELIKYVYAHTDSVVHGEEQLRRVVSTFASLYFTSFQGREVCELMKGGGDFVMDFMAKTLRHVQYLETQLETQTKMTQTMTEPLCSKCKRRYR